MTTIARAFENSQNATTAVEKLKEAGIGDTEIQVIAPQQGEETAAFYLRAGSMLGNSSSVEPYAIAIERGQTIVAAQAPFGSGVRVAAIMDACHPIPLESVVDADDPFHRGTPMSFTLGLPVLSRNNPTPLSDFLGLNTTSKHHASMTEIAGDELVDNNRPYTGFLNLPLLTKKGGAFFSALGLPTLYREEMGDKTFWFPLLINKASPLSDTLKISPLSKRPSHSSSFGIPTLLGQNNKTPQDPPPPSH